jgi:hypothetical protein
MEALMCLRETAILWKDGQPEHDRARFKCRA